MCRYIHFILFQYISYVLSASLMTDEIRIQLLNDHNYARTTLATPIATNMIKIQYDMILENVAQNYLDKNWPNDGTTTCSFQHNSARSSDYSNLGGRNGKYVGENWYSGPPTLMLDGPIFGGATQAWTTGNCSSTDGRQCLKYICSEYDSFYQTKRMGNSYCNQLNGATGHFTQVMWANTAYIGCAYSQRCGTLCNYVEGGNMNMPSPGYITPSSVWGVGGPAASNCPSTHPYNDNGLCSSIPPIVPTLTPTNAPIMSPTTDTTTTTTTTTTTSGGGGDTSVTAVPTLSSVLSPVMSPISSPTTTVIPTTTTASTTINVNTMKPTLSTKYTLAPISASDRPQVTFSTDIELSGIVTPYFTESDEDVILSSVAKVMNIRISDMKIVNELFTYNKRRRSLLRHHDLIDISDVNNTHTTLYSETSIQSLISNTNQIDAIHDRGMSDSVDENMHSQSLHSQLRKDEDEMKVGRTPDTMELQTISINSQYRTITTESHLSTTIIQTTNYNNNDVQYHRKLGGYTAVITVQSVLSLHVYQDYETTSALYTDVTTNMINGVKSGLVTYNIRTKALDVNSVTLMSSICTNGDSSPATYVHSTTMTTKKNSSEKTLTGGAIAGIVISTVVIITLCCYLYYYFVFYIDDEDEDDKKDEDDDTRSFAKLTTYSSKSKKELKPKEYTKNIQVYTPTSSRK